MICNWKNESGTVTVLVTFTVAPLPLIEPPSDDQLPSVKFVLDCNWYAWPDTDWNVSTY